MEKTFYFLIRDRMNDGCPPLSSFCVSAGDAEILLILEEEGFSQSLPLFYELSGARYLLSYGARVPFGNYSVKSLPLYILF